MSIAPVDLEIALGRFARQAQSLTLAGGAAIALTPEGEDTGDEMTCRASSGQDAPQVGARLRLVPGFRRECFREGKGLRCDDSETDARVDRERCRELGIRSVVAVPLKNNESVVGIIEIFSTRTKAFTESHMAKLHVLAERVTDAVTGVETAPVPVAAPPEPELLWADVFIESRLPWKHLVQSALCHVAVIALVWNLTLNWVKSEKILRPVASQQSRLTYYPTPSFPAAASHRPQPKAEASAKGGSQPPAPAPIVVKSRSGSSAPPKVDMPAPSRVELAGLRTAMPTPSTVSSPQRGSLAAKVILNAAPASIVAPPPQVSGALRQPSLSAPASFVVAPSPAISGPIRTMANLGVGSSKVVGPAPGLPARVGVTGPGMSIGGVQAVVGPPPSMPLHEGSGGSGLTLGGGATVVGPPTAMPLHEGTGGSRMSLGGGNGVVAPAPSLQGGLGSAGRVASVGLGGGDAVVAPAPGLPTGARSNVMSAGLGGTGTVVGPPPGIPSGVAGISSSGFGGTGMSVQPNGPPGGGTGTSGTGPGGTGSGAGGVSSGNGTGSGSGGLSTGAGAGSGSVGAGSGTGTGSGNGAGSGSAAGTSLASAAPVAGAAPKSIRTSVPQQAPTHVDDPAGRILDVPVRVIGLALALPSSSFFSNYEVFIAEREFDKSEKRLIKLVYESRPTQRRLSDYGVSVATTYKLRVKRDPTCDESAAQITGGHYSEMQSTKPDPALRDSDKDSVLPCYRTTADDYQKAASKKK